MIRLVLFDIDGTLIESGGAGVQAFGKTCAMEFKVPNGVERLRFAGRTDRAIVREFFMRQKIEPSAENFQRFFDCYVFWLDHPLPKECSGNENRIGASHDGLPAERHRSITPGLQFLPPHLAQIFDQPGRLTPP